MNDIITTITITGASKENLIVGETLDTLAPDSRWWIKCLYALILKRPPMLVVKLGTILAVKDDLIIIRQFVSGELKG